MKKVIERNTKKEILKVSDKFSKTKSHKKLLNFVKEVIESKSFQKKILDIRRSYNIPEKGFKKRDGVFYLPPFEWFESFANADIKVASAKTKEIESRVKKLCIKFSLNSHDWPHVIQHYVLYNKLEYVYDPEHCNLCMIYEAGHYNIYSEHVRKKESKMYPVLIGISAYASLRDILDFITKTYKIKIRPIQDKNKEESIMIGKIKSKNPIVKERNEFIFENRDLPRKTIKKLVEEKFKLILDYEYIGKIISDENKKRKKV